MTLDFLLSADVYQTGGVNVRGDSYHGPDEQFYTYRLVFGSNKDPQF